MGLDDRKYMDPKEYNRLTSKKPKVKLEDNKEDVQDKEIKPDIKKPWWKIW